MLTRITDTYPVSSNCIGCGIMCRDN